VLRLRGTIAGWAGAVWLSAATVATVLGPALVGGAVAPIGPWAVGCILAAILLALRSATVEEEHEPSNE
jgi:MFS family permease